MTKEEILAMEAGVKLDELVAKKVMGWHRVTHLGITAWVDDNNIIGTVGFSWDPSTDISATWLVVEKMQEQGLAKAFTLYWGKGWWCFFEYYDLAGNPTYATRGKTVPEAICKASLVTKLGGKQ